jgi:hypothetical protein
MPGRVKLAHRVGSFREEELGSFRGGDLPALDEPLPPSREVPAMPSRASRPGVCVPGGAFREPVRPVGAAIGLD